jgi:hypothetical protein
MNTEHRARVVIFLFFAAVGCSGESFREFHAAAAGTGFEESFAAALREEENGDFGGGRERTVERLLPEDIAASVSELARSLSSPALLVVPAPEEKPKKGWITAVSVATVLGSAYNSFRDGPNQRFHFLNEGFFSENTYAGGADKTSHFASYYIVAQLLAEVYEGLGLKRDQAQLLAAGVSAFAGFVTELGDGRGHYGFSYEDFVFDVLSAAAYLGIAHYGLDDLVGFSYGPLPAPDKPAGCCVTPNFGMGVPRYYDFGADYSTTIASGNFKVAGLYAHTGFDPGPARFLLMSLTYASKGYRYYPNRDLTERQIGMFVGVNFVEILKAAGVPKDKLWQKALYFLFDVIRIPYTQIGYVYDLNHSRWHGPGIGSYPTGSPAAARTVTIP